ncbi:hypothetical protein K458DRAFT_419946 [Lentithecium fluviatile CBS 122367]|uniref:F-box domain-containing protein n=1 Tax=Lentithecium fluviatile CBS 122367 TaxID=1168545 RepID=A0A6G1IWB0_9PLEO|nr:hypothetical protein K458DRAFT_419946 [Lentithecium fluviatile CBS 122367]
MMTGFCELSVDLLYVIFSHLQSDKSTLLDIALTCRIFRDISQRFIVRDVTLTHSPTLSRSTLFLRTLQERPDLIAHVHRLELDLLREDIHWPEQQNNITLIARLLTNLRDFCYLSRDYKAWHYDIPLPFQWASENAHNHVRRIEWHHNMTIEKLCKCMELPRIDSIYCRELYMTNTTASSLFTIPARSSSVTELRIGSALGLLLEDFRLMLRSPRSLRTLTLEFQDELRYGLEADRIGWLLEPVQDTLEALRISTQMGPWRTQAADSPANLSAFRSLKKLQVPLRYLIGRSAENRIHVDDLLPPKLCELTISFFSTDSRRSSYSPNASHNIKTLTDWLVNLQTNQRQSTDLANVMLKEIGIRKYYGDLNRDSVRAMDGDLGSLEDDSLGGLKLRCPVGTGG